MLRCLYYCCFSHAVTPLIVITLIRCRYAMNMLRAMPVKRYYLLLPRLFTCQRAADMMLIFHAIRRFRQPLRH